MIQISLLHPSRGRPDLAFSALNEWTTNADRPEDIEYLMQVDSDDEAWIEYVINAGKYMHGKTKVASLALRNDPPATMAKLYNNFLPHMSSSSKLMIIISDDMGCPKHWDTLLWNELEGVDCYADIKFVGVWDGTIQPRDAFLPYFIATRAWYTKLGYIAYPEYISSYIDFDWTGYVRTSDLNFGTHIEIKAQHLVFPHRHYTSGTGVQDDVNKRLHTEENLRIGREILSRREASGFGLF